MGNVLNMQPQFRPCTGCGACMLSCPNNYITMGINSEGFIRPTINDSCTQCGLCTETCIKFEKFEQKENSFYSDKTIFSFKNKNPQVLISSSSGGFIESVYRKCSESGLNLCGAISDIKENIVKHRIETAANHITPLLGSKYLPSLTSESFLVIKNNKEHNYVIVGTPCQIHGIHKWATIHKRRENFILIDFFCAGVPSYNLWKAYLKYINKLYNIGDIRSISFRDKASSDWHHYGIKIKGSNGEYYQPNAASNDLFFKLFLSDSCKQLSCSAQNCPFRTQYCTSDIRVGDYWGGVFETDTTGVSVVIPNTTKGDRLLSKFPSLVKESEIQICNLRKSHKQRAAVMMALKNGESIENVIAIIEHNNLITKIKKIFKSKILYNGKK